MKLKKWIVTLSTVALLSMGGTSAFAAWGYGDTMESAMTLYANGSYGGATLPLESYQDNDFYVIDNSNSSNSKNFQVKITPSSAINLDMQLIRTDAYNNIKDTHLVNYGGAGQFEASGFTVRAGEKMFVRVMSHGYTDFDPSNPYTIEIH